jgi:hypothetical protein
VGKLEPMSSIQRLIADLVITQVATYRVPRD